MQLSFPSVQYSRKLFHRNIKDTATAHKPSAEVKRNNKKSSTFVLLQFKWVVRQITGTPSDLRWTTGSWVGLVGLGRAAGGGTGSPKRSGTHHQCIFVLWLTPANLFFFFFFPLCKWAPLCQTKQKEQWLWSVRWNPNILAGTDVAGVGQAAAGCHSE